MIGDHMKLMGILVWILIGVAFLGFFSLNLDQSVDINVFAKTYTAVNLVVVMFLSILAGLLVGVLALTAQIIKAKSQTLTVKKSYKSLAADYERLKLEHSSLLSEHQNVPVNTENLENNEERKDESK
jgi:uncharacterized integral membrane protein